jgi:hypothetical protein
MVFSAIAAVVVVAVLGRVALRRSGETGTAGAMWVGGLVLVGAMFAYVLYDRFAARDLAAERRAIEARVTELAARSLAPGSALGCLDAVANALVENSCEKPLFASPEAVAAAVTYVDARFSLLAVSAKLAERDPSYRPAFERLRQGLENDRYGLVAHVLTTRGCNGAECAELRLLRDPARVVANMKTRTFEAALGIHALAWSPSGGAATAGSAPAYAAPPLATNEAGVGTAVTSGGPSAANSAKFDFPSANSIPAVSIMNAEPGTAPAASEPRSAVLPPKRPAAAARHQSARQAAAPAPSPSVPPPSMQPSSAAPPSVLAPPVQIAPEEPPAPPALSDPHATR